jgi:hypothetical protein
VLTITARTAGVPLEVGSLVSGSTLVSGQYVARVLSATTYALALPQAAVSSFTCTATTTFAPYPSPVLNNSPIQAFGAEVSPDIKPNGSWGDFQWCDSTGSVPVGTLAVPVAVTTAASGTNSYNFVGGQPVFPGSGTTAIGSAPGASDVYRLYFRFKSTERLLMSPFIFADNKEISTGLFGIQNIQCLFNFQNPIAAGRILRCNLNPLGKTGTTTATYTVGNALFLTPSGASSPFAVPTLNPLIQLNLRLFHRQLTEIEKNLEKTHVIAIDLNIVIYSASIIIAFHLTLFAKLLCSFFQKFSHITSTRQS